jgi:peptidoglycan/xylan/chitin deacetylase (PgdA/CDA1 family)
MRMYVFKNPGFFKRLWPLYTWDINTKEKILYFTFDDGPHPVATPFVLDTLKRYEAKATFFCIGKNVEAHPEIYQRILEEGHAVGNHTQHHLNGWKTKTNDYLEDVATAAKHIDSSLFRPPYGRIKKQQGRLIAQNTKIIMWSLLSGDFDTSLSADYCTKKVRAKAGPGSIIVFHDSEKAFRILQHTLPDVLSFFYKQGYRFEKLTVGLLKNGDS